MTALQQSRYSVMVKHPVVNIRPGGLHHEYQLEKIPA
jgi:hypothetical protein